MQSSENSPLLFVDGYNIIGAWPQLAHLRDYEGLESARYHLTEVLTNFSAYRGFQTCIVFDAYAKKHPRSREFVTDNVSIYYTDFGQTADTCIEKWCAQLRHQIRLSKQRLIVATSDQAQKLTVMGYGAEWISAQRLALEVSNTLSQGHREYRSKELRRKSRQSRRLSNGLKPDVQDRLRSLRTQLESRPRL